MSYKWVGAILGGLAVALAAVLCVSTVAAQSLEPASFLPVQPDWHGASEKLVVGSRDPWITPVEKSGFVTTPTYDETVAFVRRMDAASALLRVETFGRSAQNRNLVVVIASKDGARLNPAKPLILVQGGIHAGEIDGKDAGLMLIRDIAFKGKDSLLDRANFLFVPIFNTDGHERSSPYNRANQRGPSNMGWRHTAQNLNLNRDYLKADSPEMRAMLRLITRYDPDLYVDLHVTDGMDYQFDITFGFDGWDGLYADSPAIGSWLDKTLRPAVSTALLDNGHIPGGLIFGRSDSDPKAGNTFQAFTPRYSHAYGDLRRLPTVLVETHSLKPYRQRVLGTYVLVEAIIKVAVSGQAGLDSAIRTDRAARPLIFVASWKPAAQPVSNMQFLPVESEQVISPVTGRPYTRWNGKPAPSLMIPVYGSEPAQSIPIPDAYWVPSSRPDVIERLKLHGVKMETIIAARTVRVDMIRIGGFTLGTPQEGRFPLTGRDFTHEMRDEVFPPGSVRVSTDQPLGLVIAMMLEPQSSDSLFQWGFFPEMLQRVEYMEAYAIAPMVERLLATDPKLKAEYDAKVASDPAFTGQTRLSWLNARSPYGDQRYLLYPIGRELR